MLHVFNLDKHFHVKKKEVKSKVSIFIYFMGF